MCGICGQLRYDGQHVDLNLVSRMKESLAHRGPDDDGLWQNVFDGGELALGHTRLAVIDLTSAGHQPMLDKTQRYCIVYNGEIYNYREIRNSLSKEGIQFNSETDTEVVLQAYIKFGEHCLNLFNGMFAFSIWDNETKILFCARDRLGIKPFYYTWKNGVFCLASEMKALLMVPGIGSVPDQNSVYDYLSLGLMHHNRHTFLNDIYQLPGGHYLRLDSNGPIIQNYWKLSNTKFVRENQIDLEKLKLLIDDAVRLRLRSDLPVGILLSGGLDSSSITALAVRNNGASPTAFSLQFDNDHFDESTHAKMVAAHCNASLSLLKPQGHTLWEELDTLITAQDAPTHAPEVYSNWCMMRAVAGRNIKVLLSGQGGDELFGGYNWYPKYLLASLVRTGKFYSLMRELLKLPKNFPNSNTHGYAILLGSMLHALLPTALKLRLKPELGCMDRIMNRSLRSAMRARDFDNLRLLDPTGLEEKLYQDLNYCNIPHYLHYEDANSMAFGIEERVPFLDHRLVEWAHRLAVWWKIRGGVSKLPLRKIMKNYLPEQVVNRKDKMGLSAPRDQWFRNELRPQITDLFSGDCRIFENWFDRKAFLDELNVYLNGDVTPLSRLLWRCINLEKWLRLYA